MATETKSGFMQTLTVEEVRRRRELVENVMLKTSKNEIIAMSIPVIVMLIGFGYYYVKQLREGLIVTDLSSKVFWGTYITNFVFWIGVSHVGMLISAILRALNAEFRTPITRVAEEVTIVSLFMGAASVLIDMGRIDRIMNMFYFGRWDSPLIWDVTSILFYLVGSFIYFYTPIIPDFAYYRDNLDPDKHRFRIKLYSILSLNWRGTPEQFEELEDKIMNRFKWYIIPVALSVHTVVSWIMAMTWRPGWDSSIFGPYFIGGAIFSGTAALVSALIIFSRAYNLQDIITTYHIKQVVKILVVTDIAYMYMTVNEILTPAYKAHELELYDMIFYGRYAIMFWFIIIISMVVPMFLAMWILNIEDGEINKIHALGLIASLLVNIGAWLKRYIITVPSLQVSTFEESVVTYHPSAAEIWISLAQFSFFIFGYWFLNKIVPIVPLWEVEHELANKGLVVGGLTPQAEHEEKMKNM
ncbi:MAG: NrfD/PsrC family molybdoenzyme membrane anchor subunit [Candidatus Kariarchaeaceae archaeon]|jgi:molybdopterin-containing oxidoreductase family membrane subunit